MIFDRFHPSCLFTAQPVMTCSGRLVQQLRCGLSSTYHHWTLTWGALFPSSPSQWPTRRYHSIMLTSMARATCCAECSGHPDADSWLVRHESLQHLSCAIWRFSVPPEPCDPTASCYRLRLQGAHPPSQSIILFIIYIILSIKINNNYL